jgi:hypothetical protein
VQYRGGHISTCFNKDTRDLFMLCILCLCQLFIHYRYSLFYLCSLFIIVVHLVCSLFDFSFTLSFNFILLRFFCFIVALFKREKINSDPGLYSGISILLFQYTTSSIRVNKHHTADSTDFVLV